MKRKTEQGESDWIRYLKENAFYESYDGMCDCRSCRAIKNGFNEWMKRKRKQEPFKPTVGLSQMGCLHGELPPVLGDYDQQTMVDVLNWASKNVECVRSNPNAKHWVCEMWTIPDFGGPTLYAALLAAWKARGEK